MKAAVVTTFGAPLEIQERDIPEPAQGQVLIRMEACGLCHTDIHAAHGDWPMKPTLPLIPGHEGIGIVEKLGADVTDVAIGDRVIPHFMPDWLDGPMRPSRIAAMRGITLAGSLSEYVAVPASSVVRLPDHLDFAADAQAHRHQPVQGIIGMFNVAHHAARAGGQVAQVLTGPGVHARRLCWNWASQRARRRPVHWLSKCSILQLSTSAYRSPTPSTVVRNDLITAFFARTSRTSARPRGDNFTIRLSPVKTSPRFLSDRRLMDTVPRVTPRSRAMSVTRAQPPYFAPSS